MKLIDILIAADFEWDERYGFAAQDSDGEVWVFSGRPRLSIGISSNWNADCAAPAVLATDLADDWNTSVITRDEYLAARDAAKPKGHPHAALMAEYAEVARTNPEPWLEFELCDRGSANWVALSCNPRWVQSAEYRCKPRTIRIGEYDVPEPVREPLEDGQKYFAVSVSWTTNSACELEWSGDSVDTRLLEQGRIHLTKEAAELHTKALLSFTQQESKGESK